jgi:hypothetical protein
MTDPLELLKHVQYADTLEVAYIAQKVQAKSVRPLDLQVVIDFLPKLFATGRPELAKKLGQKPQPKIYMHLTEANLIAAYDLLKQAMAVVLILQNRGDLHSAEGLHLQIKEWAERFGLDVAITTKNALELIARAREGVV